MSHEFTAIVFTRVNAQKDARTFSVKVGNTDIDLDVSQIRFLSMNKDKVDFFLDRAVHFSENAPYPRMVGACDGYAFLQMAEKEMPVILPLPEAVERLNAAGIEIFSSDAEDE